MSTQPGVPLAGYNSRVQFLLNGGAILNFEEWRITPKVDDIPANSFEDFGGDGYVYDIGITGIRSCDLSAKGYWDIANNPYCSPPALVAGTLLACPPPPQPPTSILSIFINKAAYTAPSGHVYAPVCWQFSGLRILSAANTSMVKGRVDFEFSAKSNGQFLYPGNASWSGAPFAAQG